MTTAKTGAKDQMRRLLALVPYLQTRESVSDGSCHHSVPGLPRANTHEDVGMPLQEIDAPDRHLQDQGLDTIIGDYEIAATTQNEQRQILVPAPPDCGDNLLGARRANEPIGASSDAQRRQWRERYSDPRLEGVIRHAGILPVPAAPQSRRNGCTARTGLNRPAHAVRQAASLP